MVEQDYLIFPRLDIRDFQKSLFLRNLTQTIVCDIIMLENYRMVVFDIINKIQYGRKRIVLNYDEVTPENFLEVFSKAKPIFDKNKFDCEYLINVFLGKQDILTRPAPSTSEINNQVVVNYALPITREIVGYTFGSPTEIIQKNTDNKEQVQKVSDIFDDCNSYSLDMTVGIYASICGFGYFITLPSPDISEDNIPDKPLLIDSIDPRNAFVVTSSSVGHKQIMSCMIECDSDGNNIKYHCFTDKYKFVIDTTKPKNSFDQNAYSFDVSDNPIGKDPITMVENSVFLTGDWEQALSVLNAINLIASDSLNDIEGSIRSLLIILGSEFEDAEIKLKDIKKKRLLTLANPQGSSGGALDAKFISPTIDSNSIQNIREYLEDARNVITGIPDRSANSSGGDTGTAVLNRDGWTDIEIVARLKELFFKKAKKQQIGIALSVLKKASVIDDSINTIDIDVQIGRHTTDNLSTKASAFATLVSTGELATIDCLEFSNLTNRTNEVIERGKAYKEEKRKESLEYMKEEAALTGSGLSPTDANVAKDETE